MIARLSAGQRGGSLQQQLGADAPQPTPSPPPTHTHTHTHTHTTHPTSLGCRAFELTEDEFSKMRSLL